MLIWIADADHEKQVFTLEESAKKWVEANAGSNGDWRKIGENAWALTAKGHFYDIGFVVGRTVMEQNETDPLRMLAFKILAGDPMALDAARDILKC